MLREMAKMAQTESNDAAANKYGLLYSDVAVSFRLPHIISGYRQDGLSACECIRSLLHATNETMNVWTHVLTLVFFLMHCISVFSAPDAPQGGLLYPLASFAAGISTVYIMSIGAHTFNSMSLKAHKICYFSDYAGISFYTFTAGMAFYSYSRPLHLDWLIFNNRTAFLCLSALISFVSTSAACYMRIFCPQRQARIRTLLYSFAWLYNTFPYSVCILHSTTECNVSSLYNFNRHCLLMVAGAFAYVSHMPERLMEGSFDFLGHSHQFLHVLCAMANTDGFVTVHKDLLTRRSDLERIDPPTFANSLGLTLIVLSCNIAIVLWFTRKVYTTTDKKDE